MKITVRIGNVEVVIDRPTFKDYDTQRTANGPEWRSALMKDSILPMLTEATDKAKELYKLQEGNI